MNFEYLINVSWYHSIAKLWNSCEWVLDLNWFLIHFKYMIVVGMKWFLMKGKKSYKIDLKEILNQTLEYG